jgi:membrane associated rhomboid family serine protease
VDNNYYRPGGIGGFSFFPPVIKNLLIINAVIFFLQVISKNLVFNGQVGELVIYNWFALRPLGENFQVWQLLTYQFLHGSFSHILFNMFGLWMFGMEIEHVMGSKKFLYFYLICGVVGGLFQLLISPMLGAAPGFTIGASGAIYGVLVAFVMFFPNRYIFLYFFVPIKAKYLIMLMILFDIFLNSGANIAVLTHIGGAIAGLVFIVLDKNLDAEAKSMFRKGPRNTFGTGSGTSFNPFAGKSNPFKKKENIQEADYYEVKDEQEISQAEIDAILDKISQSGYQNLTEKEKKILFEASKKMNK